jgi:peroxiredoxin
MTIKVGDKLPEATLTTMTAEGPQPTPVSELFGGRKVVLFAVPGAFTPTCHKNHLPGFVQNAEAIRAKGVDMIVCLSVNDVFVMDAWSKSSGGDGVITFAADGNGEFTKALGLEMDASGFGMGLRSKRYSMLVDDGVVKSFNPEPQAGKAEVSGAANILSQL